MAKVRSVALEVGSKIRVSNIDINFLTEVVEIKPSLIRLRGSLFLKSLNFTFRKRVFKGLWPTPSFSHFRHTIAASNACLTGTSNHREY